MAPQRHLFPRPRMPTSSVGSSPPTVPGTTPPPGSSDPMSNSPGTAPHSFSPGSSLDPLTPSSSSLMRAGQSGVYGSGSSGYSETDILPLRTYQSHHLLCLLIQYYQRDYCQHSGLALALHLALTRALDRSIWTSTLSINQFDCYSIRYAATSS